MGSTLIVFLSDNGACAEWEPFGFDLQPVANPKPGTGSGVGTPGEPNILHHGAALAGVGGPGSLFGYGLGWANASNTPFRFYKHYDHEGGISTPLIVHWPLGTKRKGEFERGIGHVVDLMATCADVAGGTYPRTSEGNRAVRDGKWKLVGLNGGPGELYDFDVDRAELHDVAGRHPTIVARLAKAWDEWAARYWVTRPRKSRAHQG